MRLPSTLRRMDDRVLGDRLTRRQRPDAGVHDEPLHESTTALERPGGPPPPSTGRGAREAVAVVSRVSRVVLLLLAATVVLGIVFVLAPTNADNVIVRNVQDLAGDAAGPFRDVFTVDDDAEREVVVNYAFAAAVYVGAAALVRRLAGGKSA